MKLSELKDTDIICVREDLWENIMSVEDFKIDYENEYENIVKLKVYTTKEYNANLSAKDMLDSEILSEAENNMYEDWDKSIQSDIKKEDIDDIQIVLDRILSRSPSSNISYQPDELIEIDL